MAAVRFSEESMRRNGLKGTQTISDGRGKTIEFDFHSSEDSAKPILIFENGLGDPLECWDWIVGELRGRYRMLRYHRSSYFRTTSQGSSTQILETLLRELAPNGDLHFIGHSIGALVVGNTLAGSKYLLNRTRSVTLIDGTDPKLLDQDRSSKVKTAQFKQATMQQIFSAVTGVDRWTPRRLYRDVEYRPDVQQSFITSLSNPRVRLSAQREYFSEPTRGLAELSSRISKIQVIAAGNNQIQQQAMAQRIQADFGAVPGSMHRSIIGSTYHARSTCALIESFLS